MSQFNNNNNRISIAPYGRNFRGAGIYLITVEMVSSFLTDWKASATGCGPGRTVNEATNPMIDCRYFPPGPRSPSQPKGIAAAWPVPNYTARWQRHVSVNNLPVVVTQRRPDRESNRRPMQLSGGYTTIRLRLDAVRLPFDVIRRRSTVESQLNRSCE